MPDYQRRVVLGKNVSFALLPFEPNSAGLITYDPDTIGSQSLRGRADRATMDLRRITEEVSALDADLDDNVAYRSSWRLGLSGFKLQKQLSDDPGSQLPDPIIVMFAYFHTQVVITTPRSIFKFWGLNETYGWPVERARNIETITFIPVRVVHANGTFNPYIIPNPSAP